MCDSSRELENKTTDGTYYLQTNWGINYESILQELAKNLDTKKVEGYIVRLADSYKQSDCDKSIAKFVRAGHVQPDGEHWLRNAKQNGDLIKPVMPYFMG